MHKTLAWTLHTLCPLELVVAPACASGPCKNGGKCIAKLSTDGSGSGSAASGSGSGDDNDYTCICLDGYTGDRCETGEYAIMIDSDINLSLPKLISYCAFSH